MSDVFRRAGGWFARQRPRQPAAEPRPHPATTPPTPAPTGPADAEPGAGPAAAAPAGPQGAGRRPAVPRAWRPRGGRDGGGAAIQVAPDEERGATAETATEMEPRKPGEPPVPPPEGPLLQRSTVVAGIYAWSFVGLAIVTLGVLYVLQFFGVVVFPLILALFPAALLVAPTRWLKRYMPDALAAVLVLLGFVAVFSALVAVLIPSVMQELTSEGGIVEQLETGFAQVQQFLADGPFGFQPVQVDDILQQAQEQIAGAAQLAPQVLSAAGALVEGFAGLLFGAVALFFYLKDGESIGNFLRDLFPERWRPDAVQIGKEAWETVGGYIRGQLIVGLVDGVLIGIGLAIIGVPLVIPLAVITFIGGLFPIIGATVAGIIAVVMALATGGPSDALFTALLVFAVQQIEGDLLAPVVLGRATQLHPLAILGFLAAGGIIGGILGAFLAVPVGASVVRAVGHIRHRIPG